MQRSLAAYLGHAHVPCIALLALIAPTSLWLARPHRNLARVDVLATATCLVTVLSGAGCAFGNFPYSCPG